MSKSFPAIRPSIRLSLTVLFLPAVSTQAAFTIFEATGPDAAAMTFEFGSARIAATGTITTIASANPTDENSFEEPRKIVSVTTTASGLGSTFVRTLPPYSLTILRVGRR